MTRDASEIITSDGTATLRFRDPNTFAESATSRHRRPRPRRAAQRTRVHPREEIYANIWHTDRIARISPHDGHVIAWIDLAGILPAPRRSTPNPS